MGSPVWMANPNPLTPPCLTPPRDARPREELRDSCSWQSLDPAHLPSQGSLLLLPSMNGSLSSIRTLLRGREDAAGRDLKKQEELQYRQTCIRGLPLGQSSSQSPYLWPAPALRLLGGLPWTEARGTSSRPSTSSKSSTPELDYMHQGQGSSHPGPVPTWPPSHHAAAPWGLFPVGMSRVGKGQ